MAAPANDTARGNAAVIDAQVPLKEMFGYIGGCAPCRKDGRSIRCRSITTVRPQPLNWLHGRWPDGGLGVGGDARAPLFLEDVSRLRRLQRVLVLSASGPDRSGAGSAGDWPLRP